MMGRHDRSHSGAVGRLTIVPAEGDGLVSQTLEFVRRQLPHWRDDPQRPRAEAEKSLNSSLVDFLDSRARTHLPMARFKHEAPQSPRRAVDIGVHANAEVLIEATPYSIYEPFLVIEAKRLPSPGGIERETEYVSGFDPRSRAATGGIQRFKLGAHGRRVQAAAMVGFIQEDTPTDWHGRINSWILGLSAKNDNDCNWTMEDCLQKLNVSNEDQVAVCSSIHGRSEGSVSPAISLRHLWVVMNSDASPA